MEHSLVLNIDINIIKDTVSRYSLFNFRRQNPFCTGDRSGLESCTDPLELRQYSGAILLLEFRVSGSGRLFTLTGFLLPA